MNALYRVRGVTSTAIVWATGWAALAFPTFAFLLRHVEPPLGLRDLAVVARAWGLAGAGTGATFALLVIAFERRRTLTIFSPGRAAMWGAVAGAGYSALTIARFLAEIGRPQTQVVSSLVVGGLLGAGSAALTLALARRANAAKNRHAQADIAAPAT